MSPVTVPGLRYAAVLSREAELHWPDQQQEAVALAWPNGAETDGRSTTPAWPNGADLNAEVPPQHGPTEQKPKAEARPPAWPSGVSTVPFTGASSRLVQQSGIWWSRTKLWQKHRSITAQRSRTCVETFSTSAWLSEVSTVPAWFTVLLRR